jgi:hypothetical protein
MKMKTIIRFFVTLWKWFISLFKREPEKKVEPQKVSTPEIQWTPNPVVPNHNNRRNTRGRFVQYVNVGEGRQRAIYHSCK